MDSNDPRTSDLVDRLRAYWTANSVQPRSGVPLDQIEAFESRYLVRLPSDLRHYFSAMDGMEEGETDPDIFAFFPLHQVKSIPEELALFEGIPNYTEITQSLPDADRWFVIVDFLVRSAVYAIHLSKDAADTSILWIGSGDDYRIVAPSFSAFLEAYLANPYSLV